MNFDLLQSKLSNPTIHSKQLLSKVVFFDKKCSEFTDPRHLPFYYHLGKMSKSKSLFHIDALSALEDVCFIQGAGSDYWVNYDMSLNIFSNLASKNVKRYCDKVVSCTNVQNFENYLSNGFDAIITNIEYLEQFRDSIWFNLFHGGLLIVDNIYTNEDGKIKFSDFARSVSRKPTFFETRYGIGIVER